MFDIGWMELMVIGIVALIVVGPKDLPEMFRQLGRFTAKLRQMGREFSRAMEQAANESGVNEVRKDLKAMTNPVATGMDAVKSAADKFEKWDPLKNAAKPSAPLPTRTAADVAAAGSAVSAMLVPDEAPATVAPAAPAAAATLGPATAALAEKQAARKAAAAEAAEKLRSVSAAPAVPAAAAAPVAEKKPGRVRKAAAKPATDTAGEKA